jgi:hypothetical protein
VSICKGIEGIINGNFQPIYYVWDKGQQDMKMRAAIYDRYGSPEVVEIIPA